MNQSGELLINADTVKKEFVAPQQILQMETYGPFENYEEIASKAEVMNGLHLSKLKSSFRNFLHLFGSSHNVDVRNIHADVIDVSVCRINFRVGRESRMQPSEIGEPFVF